MYIEHVGMDRYVSYTLVLLFKIMSYLSNVYFGAYILILFLDETRLINYYMALKLVQLILI